MIANTQPERKRNETIHMIGLAKLRRKMTKGLADRLTKVIEQQPMGVKIQSVYWTLGRYDVVLIGEVPDEKAAMAFYYSSVMT